MHVVFEQVHPLLVDVSLACLVPYQTNAMGLV